jgi:di/tricarboxylate transporter
MIGLVQPGEYGSFGYFLLPFVTDKNKMLYAPGRYTYRRFLLLNAVFELQK